MKITLGIPTLNRADLLAENLADLSKNFSDLDHLVIVDNGNQKIKIPDNIKGRTEIHTPGKNLGVAVSWNYIMDKAFNEHGSDHVFILNDDIVFGQNREYVEALLNNLPGYYLAYGTYFWSLFFISKEGYETVGKFDETFFPAYFEDNDYWYRTLLSSPEKKWHRVAGLAPVVQRNSMTIKKNGQINKNFSQNKAYFRKKWGGLPMHETFKTPFNK